MNEHSADSRDRERRWRAAQAKEDEFWKRGTVLEGELRRVRDRYEPVFREVAGRLGPDARILDVGCGPTCPARLFDVAARVFLDPLMESYASTYGDALPPDGLVAARAEELPVPDGSFDVAVSTNALDHMVDPDAVLGEIHRVLKADGTFVLGIFLHSPPIAVLRRFVDRWLPFAREDAHPYHFTRESIRSLLERRFRVEREILVHRKDDALVPSFHREDRVYLCRR